jgi:hypothetical protein
MCQKQPKWNASTNINPKLNNISLQTMKHDWTWALDLLRIILQSTNSLWT